MARTKLMIAAGTLLLLSAALLVSNAEAQAPRAPVKSAPGGEQAAAPSSGSNENALRQRVEQLEEQLVDLQVVVGTLESLARSGANAAPLGSRSIEGAAYGASDPSRIEGIETQIRALTSQLEQLAEQVRSSGGGARRGDNGGPPGGSADYSTNPANPAFASPAPTQGAPVASARDDGGFGSTTVTPGANDAIGSLITENGGAAARPGSRQDFVALPPADGQDAANSKQLYETAYGHLLQQDYGAAEVAFDEFLKRFPGDPLSGNAQYWLGETYFVRGQFKAAASAFLKGYQTYASSAKAPDSLLKLAMSLDRLGQKDAACSSYNELGQKFPDAPAQVKSRAQAERKRVGCS